MNRFNIRQAKEMQAKLARAQEELASLTVEASSGGGAVKVILSGDQKVQSVKISPEVIEAQDVELLEDLMVTAVNDALERSQQAAQQYLSSLTGGFNIPGIK